MESNDSNAIMLPGKKLSKKEKKKKTSDKVKAAKISKSQQRKLKRLEEEKEKAALLSQSMDTLEKCRLNDEVYSLMWSSKNLGQVETVREKRQREVQFSKAGMKSPYNKRPSKKRAIEHTTHEVEDCIERDGVKSYEFTEEIRQVPNDSSIYHRSSEDINVRDVTVSPGLENSSIGPETGQNMKISRPECMNKFLSPCNGNGNVKGKVDEDKKVDCGSTKILVSSPPSKPPGSSRQKENDIVGTCSESSRLHANSNSNSQQDRTLVAPTVVHVHRPKEVESQRKNLPIIMMEQEIMEAINENSSVIICGETGCGKTTQVPQFLFEAGYGSKHSSSRHGLIGVTQPRRVAVLATAKRVAYELGVHLGKEVGFQVRHDKKIGGNSCIKFMTDGILLREIQTDFLLKRYSIIILDEAHERSLNTDILIGMLSRVIPQRQKLYEEQQKRLVSGEHITPENMIFPLKLVLMSATLRVEDFVSGRKIFNNPPPVIDVPTRQYPVTIHFAKRTDTLDYVGQAYKKVVSIHKRLPPGGILVFVTGVREVKYLCQKLRRASITITQKLISVNNQSTPVSEDSPTVLNDLKNISEAFDSQGSSNTEITDRFGSYDEDHDDFSENESESSCDLEDESDLEFFNPDEDSLNHKSLVSDGNLVNVLEEDESLSSLKAAFEALAGKKSLEPVSEGKEMGSMDLQGGSNMVTRETQKKTNDSGVGPLRVLPLYAMLPASDQLRVFEEIKEGERLVVVATNVAETSLTIPGIKYVVDTGREKVKKYNSSNGMEEYEIQWISQASAAQRAGRSGRTGPGHCYRLYSSAVFSNIFPEFSSAEILKVPVEGVVLLMKSMHISKVSNFPFPTPPEAMAIAEAERCLKVLGALDSTGRLTTLGKAMARYPMSPRHSRMLLTVILIMRSGRKKGTANLILGYAVAAAAALSMSNPFTVLSEASHKERDDNSGTAENEETLRRDEKLRKKEHKDKAKIYRAKFCNPVSDVLTTSFALQCFELSTSPAEFCSDNALHLKTMEEMSKLRKQLLQLIFSLKISDLQSEFKWTYGGIDDIEVAWRVPSEKNPLSGKDEEIICQAICAGWADRVAKRVIDTSGLSDGDKKVNAIRYQACSVDETVFLHRWSSLSRTAPKFLVYSELLRTKRPYIHGATSVKEEWIADYAPSMCIFSSPHADREPDYDCITDQVFCWVTPTYGPHLWQLSDRRFPIEDNMKRVAVFARALLDGRVLKCIKSKRVFLAEKPKTIIRPEASGVKRVGNLLNKLKSRNRVIDSCAKLRELWEENPRELFPEIQDWFQEKFHGEFEELWVDMHRECKLFKAPRGSDKLCKAVGVFSD